MNWIETYAIEGKPMYRPENPAFENLRVFFVSLKKGWLLIDMNHGSDQDKGPFETAAEAKAAAEELADEPQAP